MKRFKVVFYLLQLPVKEFHTKYFNTLEKALNYAIKRLTAINSDDFKYNPFFSTEAIIHDHKAEVENIILESHFGNPSVVDPQAICTPNTSLNKRYLVVGKEEILKVFLKKKGNLISKEEEMTKKKITTYEKKEFDNK